MTDSSVTCVGLSKEWLLPRFRFGPADETAKDAEHLSLRINLGECAARVQDRAPGADRAEGSRVRVILSESRVVSAIRVAVTESCL